MTTNRRTIDARALRAVREKAGLSQEDLAGRCREMGKPISKKAIYRYERGETAPTEKKAQWLAQALRVSVDVLRQPPEEDTGDEASARSLGYRTIKITLDRQSRQNLRLVAHHYGVSPLEVIEAAPWMFTLLAEMSLAERKRAVEQVSDAVSEIDGAAPGHLHQAAVGAQRIVDAIADEEDSIRTRDIFGDLRSGSDWVFAFERDLSNPFVEFLRRQARGIASDAIDADRCEFFGGHLPTWSIFEDYVDQITNGDSWARYAIEHEHVRVRDIPEELLGSDKSTERAAWLAERVPPEARQKAEKEQSEFQALLSEQGFE